MADKFYTISGAAEYKKVTYPTIKNAITKGKLKPITANAGLKEAQPVQLLTEAQLYGWTKARGRLTDDQRLGKAADMLKSLGISTDDLRTVYNKKKK